MSQQQAGAPGFAPIEQQSSFGMAIAAGVGAAIVGAVLWAAITVISGWKLGVVAIAIGYIVGQAIRTAGKGNDQKFAILGAVCALFGCVLGDVLGDLAAVATMQGVGTERLLALLGTQGIDLIGRIVVKSFDAMDLVFYAIAVYEGFRFSVVRQGSAA